MPHRLTRSSTSISRRGPARRQSRHVAEYHSDCSPQLGFFQNGRDSLTIGSQSLRYLKPPLFFLTTVRKLQASFALSTFERSPALKYSLPLAPASVGMSDESVDRRVLCHNAIPRCNAAPDVLYVTPNMFCQRWNKCKVRERRSMS